MSPTGALSAFAAAGFPRVSGDEPCEENTVNIYSRFSPRERG